MSPCCCKNSAHVMDHHHNKTRESEEKPPKKSRKGKGTSWRDKYTIICYKEGKKRRHWWRKHNFCAYVLPVEEKKNGGSFIAWMRESFSFFLYYIARRKMRESRAHTEKGKNRKNPALLILILLAGWLLLSQYTIKPWQDKRNISICYSASESKKTRQDKKKKIIFHHSFISGT